MINRIVVHDKLVAYLNGELSLPELVDWAENSMMDGEFDLNGESEVVIDIVSRLGLADVREFGLTWDDVQEYLFKLGYTAQVTVEPVG